MNKLNSPAPLGRIASLHLHPREGGEPFQNVASVEVETGKGIVGNPRYFSRRSPSGGLSKRQVSLIEREQISEHASALGLETISPGLVRSNIETTGVNLSSLIGQKIQVGEAVLFLYEARKPCSKMEAICAGLRKLMEENRQGVLAQVVQSGRIYVGDTIRIAKEIASAQLPQNETFGGGVKRA